MILSVFLAFIPAEMVCAQQQAPSPTATPSPVMSAAGTPMAAPVPTTTPQAPVTAQAPAQAPVPGQPAIAAQTAPSQAVAAPGMAVTKAAAPQDANPFSPVKTTDDRTLHQELPILEQRLKLVEDKMSTIQQVQAVLPADALGGPRTSGQPGAGGPVDPAVMELEASTFVACVNGKAMFRDTDQKPFFVDAKEANQNEAVRRIGGCKH